MQTNDKNTIFLSPGEAVEAIRLDLEQYPPQPILLRRLAQLILGEERILSEDDRRSGLWVKVSAKRGRRLLTYEQLPEYLVGELERKIEKLSMKKMAEICACVFQVKANEGASSPGGPEGVVVETGMEDFRCRQCGQCCRFLDYRKELADEDYKLWEELGREDILKKVKVIRKEGEVVGYRIWIDPVTGQVAETCPWLKKDSENNRYLCTIHDVRPRICRQYPGSRKHARMTGCPGFKR
jgi:Fe-S-cluster containining protein